jgi:hypothetical protein
LTEANVNERSSIDFSASIRVTRSRRICPNKQHKKESTDKENAKLLDNQPIESYDKTGIAKQEPISTT